MYQEIKARGEVSRWIESYWEAQASTLCYLPPDGTAHLLFLPQGGELQGLRLAAGFYLLPLQMRAICVLPAGRLFGLRVKAFAMPLLQKSPLLEALPALGWQLSAGSKLRIYLESAWAMDMPLEHICGFWELLCEELWGQNQSLWSGSLRDKVNYILFQRGEISVDTMAKDFGISRQRLHQIFSASLQISPKNLANIWQFNHFLALLQPSQSLTFSALDAGYYDQAHGTHAFRARFGCSPSEWLRLQNQPSLQFARQCIIKRFNNDYDPSPE